jgi:plasmid stability protein
LKFLRWRRTPDVNLRKLDKAARARLEARASRDGRSVEAEACAIIEEATEEEGTRGGKMDNLSLAEFMQANFKDIGLTDDEWVRFNIAISDLNSYTSTVDFDADEYEETVSDK